MGERYTISPAGENANSGVSRWHAPAGLYLTRGDGVAVRVTAEMLASALVRGYEPISVRLHDARELIAKLLEQPT